MRCDEARALLPSYVEGDAAHKEWCALDRHLQECPQCMGALRMEQQLCALLQHDAASRWTPPDLRLLIRLRIAAAETRPRHRLAAAGMVSAVLALAVSVFSWQAVPAAVPTTTPRGGLTAAPQRHSQHVRYCLGCRAPGAERQGKYVLADTGFQGTVPDAPALHPGAQFGVSTTRTSIRTKGGERVQGPILEYSGMLAS